VTPNALSLAPVVLALVLAFWTKNAAFSLLVGCLVGGVIGGADPVTGLVGTFQQALGNPDFIWVMMIEVAVGVMIAFYLRAGSSPASPIGPRGASTPAARPRDSRGASVCSSSSATTSPRCSAGRSPGR
jgi:hypothetical protein